MGGSDQRDHHSAGEGRSVEWLADGTGWEFDEYEEAFRRLEEGWTSDPALPAESIVVPPGFDDVGADDVSDDEHWRRPRAVRVTGFVVAASLLLATIGTTVGAIFGSGTATPEPLSTTVRSVGPPEAAPALERPGSTADAAERRELVTFTVAGVRGEDGAAICTVVVTRRGSVLGSTSREMSLTGVGALVQRVIVPIDETAFVGSPDNAAVTCQPTAASSPATANATD